MIKRLKVRVTLKIKDSFSFIKREIIASFINIIKYITLLKIPIRVV